MTFKATVAYTGEVWLNDCDDSQVKALIGGAVSEFIKEAPLDYSEREIEITDISNEDLTSNDYPQ